MRRLHVLVKSWGALLANTSSSAPAKMPSGTNDTSSVRWAVRTDERDSGFLFLNNYQRLHPLPDKHNVRFSVRSRDGSSTLQIPSPESAALTVKANTWWTLPLNLPLMPGFSTKIAYATAQPVSRVMAVKSETIFLLQIDGLVPEIALANCGPGGRSSISVAKGVTVTTEGDNLMVLRGATPGTSAFAQVALGGGVTVQLVLLPWAFRDRLWHFETASTGAALLISEEVKGEGAGAQYQQQQQQQPYRAMLLQGDDATTVHLRTNQRASTTCWVFPQSKAASSPDGVFSKISVSVYPGDPFPGSSRAGGMPTLPPPALKLLQKAAPPRNVPHAPSHKAQEPKMEEWAAAEKYSLTLNLPAGWDKRGEQSTELTLAIDYAGDAARIYYKDRLLTDNWFSGYRGDGAMEVGLTYLSGENPGMLLVMMMLLLLHLLLLLLMRLLLRLVLVLQDGAVLELWILPLKKSTIALNTTAPEGEAQVFIQEKYWPEFVAGRESALKVNALTWVQTAHIPLNVF